MRVSLPIPLRSIRPEETVTGEVLLGPGCRITLSFGPYELEAEAADFFESLCQVRQELEVLGYRPVCFGASRRVYVPPGEPAAAGGLMGYRLTLGQPVAAADEVGIFDRDAGVVPVSVPEQRAFYERWRASRACQAASRPAAGPEAN